MRLSTVLACLAWGVSLADEPPPLPPPAAADGLSYWNESRTEPRPLRIHILQLNLTSPRYEPTVLVNDDPDGDGPAEAALSSPLEMAAAADLVAAVNGAIFGGLPDAAAARISRWKEGMPVELLGLIVADGQERSPPERPYPYWWYGPGRGGGIAPGETPAADGCRQAVAGFGVILRAGEIATAPGGAVHPRTAAGWADNGTRLVLVVADGRWPGVSEGLSEHELAAVLQQLGCHDAVNLDGGGSSIMLVGDLERPAAAGIRVMNKPSDGRPRPLPALLGIRRVTAKAGSK